MCCSNQRVRGKPAFLLLSVNFRFPVSFVSSYAEFRLICETQTKLTGNKFQSLNGSLGITLVDAYRYLRIVEIGIRRFITLNRVTKI